MYVNISTIEKSILTLYLQIMFFMLKNDGKHRQYNGKKWLCENTVFSLGYGTKN